jgi:hypothetical protein
MTLLKRRGTLALSAWIALCLAAAGATAHAQPVAGADQVKAAYVLNFARFIEWPVDVLPPTSPLHLVVIGDDPVAGALDSVPRERLANGHPMQFRHLQWNDVLAPCDIVYISASEKPHLAAILLQLRNRSVLTVSDIDHFALRGGIIELRMVGNRVRFDINTSTAIRARLEVSAKLLRVARAVRGSGAR